MRTYVIRLREPRPEEGPAELMRGFVEDVTTGQRATFTDATQLLTWLAEPEGREGSASAALGGGTSGRERS